MRKISFRFLTLCLVVILLLTNVCTVFAVSNEEREKGLIQRVEILDSVSEDAIILSEGYEVILVEVDGGSETRGTTSGLYELTIHHKETYSVTTGIGYLVEASCSNPACQISYLEGTATVSGYDDYLYGTYDMYTRNWLVTNRIANSRSTGLILYPGTTGLYVGYDFYINIVNGYVLNGGNFHILSDKLTIPG